MKKIVIAFAAVLAAFTFHASAQTVTTWIHPPNAATNQTLMLGHNQVMEVLSLSLDNDSSIDITVGDRTLTLGRDGTEIIPQPLVVAGPAVVQLRRRSSGDDGSLMTFRVVQIEKPASAPGKLSSR